MKKIEVFFFANRPLQGFNPLTKVYWKIRVFGEVGVSLFVAGAAFRDILIDSRSAKCCIFPYKMRLQDAKSKVSEAAGAR